MGHISDLPWTSNVRCNAFDSSMWILTAWTWAPNLKAWWQGGPFKSNVFGTMVRLYIFCKYTDTKRPMLSLLCCQNAQNIPIGYEKHLSNNKCTTRSCYLGFWLVDHLCWYLSFLSFHVPHMCWFSHKSPQVSVSVIKRLFFELSNSDLESGEEIPITFIAFTEPDVDKGHIHITSPFP